ncbi:hypothetical protein KUTeg_003469 [Tegillarca granosa]|uniref:SH3 domain-containing protein n=1 Tax=Tegillarca granosa TaxID=220873 RepID=A0ABQ9FM88_TEGGR|nr:hypothetical protein KUTeg_003469 [Tegillarca granosa]
MRKFRKKTKNKMVYDEHKEAQYVKILHKCQERLDDYRYQGLKLALLEERKCHCFVLDRLSSMANMYALHHKQASDILNSKIGHWKQLSTKPHILPSSADKLITPQAQREEMFEHMNGVGMYRENGYLRDDTRSLGSPYRRPASVPGVYRHPEGDFYSPEMYSRTLPSSRGISVPPPTPPGVLQVRGVYSHVGEGDSKLSFAEGDVINLIGEKSDGWHYGQNTRSGKYGWFPLSFTEPILIGGPPREPAPSLQSRAKSLGELDNQSLSENSGYNFEHDIPGNIRRPKSMYDGSNLRLVNSTSQVYFLYLTLEFKEIYGKCLFISIIFLKIKNMFESNYDTANLFVDFGVIIYILYMHEFIIFIFYQQNYFHILLILSIILENVFLFKCLD